MAFEEGGERIDDMKAVLGRTADAATLFDTDGIVVRFMNGTIEGNGIRSEAEAAALVQQVKFSGTAPTTLCCSQGSCSHEWGSCC